MYFPHAASTKAVLSTASCYAGADQPLSFPELCSAAEAIAMARACGCAATQILHGKHEKRCDSLGVVENAQGIWRAVPERGVR